MNSKPRYDWFQTESAVTLCVSKRGLAPSDVRCTYVDGFLTLEACGEEIFAGRLTHPVEKANFSLQVTSRKVEVQMPKATVARWERLVLDAEAPTVRLGPLTQVDWNKLEREVIEEEKEENEKDDGDSGMQSALRALYKCADPDAQRAMTKSYVESGGTVLNMNWGEVAKKKIEVSPPVGCEFRKFGQ